MGSNLGGSAAASRRRASARHPSALGRHRPHVRSLPDTTSAAAPRGRASTCHPSADGHHWQHVGRGADTAWAPRPPRPAGGRQPDTRPPAIATGSRLALSPTRPRLRGRRVPRARVDPPPVDPRSPLEAPRQSSGAPQPRQYGRRVPPASAIHQPAHSYGADPRPHLPLAARRPYRRHGLGSLAAASLRRRPATCPPTVIVLTAACAYNRCHTQHVGRGADTASASSRTHPVRVSRAPGRPPTGALRALTGVTLGTE